MLNHDANDIIRYNQIPTQSEYNIALDKEYIKATGFITWLSGQQKLLWKGIARGSSPP